MQNISSQSSVVQTTLENGLSDSPHSSLKRENISSKNSTKTLAKLKLQQLKIIDNISEHQTAFPSRETIRTELKKVDLEPQTAWETVLKALSEKLDSKIVSAWLNPIKIGGISTDKGVNAVCLIAPSKFAVDHLKKNYGELVIKELKKILNSEQLELRFEVNNDNGPLKVASTDSNSSSRLTQEVKAERKTETKIQHDAESNLSINYNFSNFVVGSCNQFAHAACSKVAESPGISYNPLLIYGGVGLGKTHLANAIGNAARRRKKKVLLVSSEHFVSELISSLKNNSMERFRAKFRTLDVLIIDDIQFIIGKERTQEEFFHTFNELYGKNKQIIITSDKLPQDLIGLEERLRTRFQSGLSVDLQPPDYETRVAILKNKCEQSNFIVSDEILKLIAVRIDTNVRELEGALTRLQALSSLLGEDPSLNLAQKVLDTISPQRTRELTTENIKEIVAKEFNVSIQDLAGKRRTQNIALARQVAMYLCRKYTARSFPEIGALFGGRDHSTVIHAIKSITDRMPQEEILRQQIEKIIKKVEC